MRHQPTRRRGSEGSEPQSPREVTADPIESARAIAATLPDAVTRAEAAGLSIIAQHLGKALMLARRIAASGEAGGEARPGHG